MFNNNSFWTWFNPSAWMTGWNVNQSLNKPTKQQKFPWLNADQIKRLESLTSDPQEQQALYKQAIQQLNSQNYNENRIATENEMTYKSLNTKDTRQQNYLQSNVRLEQLADLTKQKFWLNANADTQSVINWLIQYATDKGVDMDSLNDYLAWYNDKFIYEVGLKEETTGHKIWQVATDIIGWAYDSATSLARRWAKWLANAVWWTAKKLWADEEKTDALVQWYKDFLDEEMSGKSIWANQESIAYNVSKWVWDFAQVMAGEWLLKNAVQWTARWAQLLNHLKTAPTWQKIVAWWLEWAGDMALYSIVAENKLPSSTEEAIGAGLWAAIPWAWAVYKATKPVVQKALGKTASQLELSGLLNPAKLNAIKDQLIKEWTDLTEAWLKGWKAEDVWNWMIERGFKWDKPTLINNLWEHANKSHKLKREILSASDSLHDVESAKKSLQVVYDTIKDVPWLENKLARVEELMGKQKHTLSELDEIKSILDDTKSIYTQAGDAKAWAVNKWLDIVRKDLRKYIEDAATKEWLGNVKLLNNETQIAKWLQDAISRKDSADMAREMLGVFSKTAIGWVAWYNVWPFDSSTLWGKVWNIVVWALAGKYLFSTKAKTNLASYINKMSGGSKKELERLIAGDISVKKLSKNTQKELASAFEKSWIMEAWTPTEMTAEEYQALLKKYSNSDLPALEFKEWIDDAGKNILAWDSEKIIATPEWVNVREWQIAELPKQDKLTTVREKAYKNVDAAIEEAKVNGLEPWTAEYDKLVWKKLYDEFEDSFDDLLAEHMSNNPEKAHLIDPDELRYLVNDNQRLPAWVTHPIVKELAERQYNKVVDELVKSWKKNALVMGWWSWAWKWFVRKHYKLAENWFKDWRPADIIVDKVSWVEEANDLVKKWFDVQQYWVIPRAENVVLNISQRAFEQGRWLSIPKVWREAHLRFVDQFLNGRPNKWALSPMELYANSLNGEWKYNLKLLWLRDNLVEVPWEWGFTKYIPEAWWKWAVEIPMSEWRKALEDYEKEIGVELSNDKIEKVVKEKFLDTWKIDKSRYKELVTWISWLLLLWLANLWMEKEEA